MKVETKSEIKKKKSERDILRIHDEKRRSDEFDTHIEGNMFPADYSVPKCIWHSDCLRIVLRISRFYGILPLINAGFCTKE